MPNPPPDEITLGEVWRGLQQLRGDFHEDMARVERKVDALDLVPQQQFQQSQREQDRRLTALENADQQRRTQVYGVILGVIASVLVALISGGVLG